MSRAKGNIAEERAALFLEERGYLVTERNFYSRFGEIDIIATKSNVLHFVEVKSGEDYEKAIQNMTPSKINKLIKTAYVFMKKNSYDGDFSFDACIVVFDDINLVENITL